MSLESILCKKFIDIDELKNFLKNNTTDKDGGNCRRSYIHMICCESGRDVPNIAEVLRILIKEGFNMNIKNNHGDTPIQDMIGYSKYHQLALIMIDAGVNLNKFSYNVTEYTQGSPLSLCFQWCGFDVARAILKTGYRPDHREWKSVMYNIHKCFDKDILKFILGLFPVERSHGQEYFFKAVENQNRSIITEMAKYISDYEICYGWHKENYMHLACRLSSDFLEWFVEEFLIKTVGRDTFSRMMEKKNKWGKVPIIAVREGSINSLRDSLKRLKFLQKQGVSMKGLLSMCVYDEDCFNFVKENITDEQFKKECQDMDLCKIYNVDILTAVTIKREDFDLHKYTLKRIDYEGYGIVKKLVFKLPDFHQDIYDSMMQASNEDLKWSNLAKEYKKSHEWRICFKLMKIAALL